mmetsp:Transcript_28960/g.55422  ORF Transcript_28960/g.55422 Transcript_28960/m.55422 type:complete len:292 (+) Transcript_28960:488-1363(+)
MLHFDQVWLFFQKRELLVEAGPVIAALSFFVVVKEASLGLAAQAAFFNHPEGHVIRDRLRIGVAHRRHGGFGDLRAEVQRGLVHQLNWAHREAQQLCRVVQQWTSDTFTRHHHTFVDVGDDTAVGVEEALIVHNNWRLADLTHIVERLCHCTIAGFLAFDDLHQRHFLHRGEEVDADELLFAHRGFRQAGDRQGGSVGSKNCILRDNRLNLLGHLGFHTHIFEHRFDDQVDVRQIVQVCGGIDAGQHGLFLLRRHLTALDAFIEIGLGVGFTAIRRFLVGVDQHNIHASLR